MGFDTGTDNERDVVGGGRYALNFLLAGFVGLGLSYFLRRRGWLATWLSLPVGVGVAFIIAAIAASGGASEGTEHHNRGVELGDEGRWQEAIVELDMAIELDGDPLSYLARGTVYGLSDDFERALADLDKAIELDPGLGDAYSERAAVYVLQGDTESALADLRTALPLVEDESARAEIMVFIEVLGGELPEGELSPKRCEELATVNPGGIIAFEGDLTVEEKIECGRLLSQ